MQKYLLFSVLCIVLLNACDNVEDVSEVEIIVSSELITAIDPVGGKEADYMQIKEIGNDPGYWNTVRPHGIKGFDYQEGYEYILLVRKIKIKNPLQDQSNIRYEFIKIISKTWKD